MPDKLTHLVTSYVYYLDCNIRAASTEDRPPSRAVSDDWRL